MVKKIINPGSDIVSQSIEGYVNAYPKLYEPFSGESLVVLKDKRKAGHVSLVIGGGSGHEPMFSGFVGKGLADAAVCGNIFTSPNPQLIYNAAKRVGHSSGILFLYGNYAGDNMNFDMAEEMLNDDGIRTAHYRVRDDCASAPRDRVSDRRGIAGDVFSIKIAGAACDAGLDLDEVLRVCEKLSDRMATIGLATSPGSIPGLDKATFELGESEIEYGMGLHGEPGIERTSMQDADTLTDRLYSELKSELGLSPRDEVCVLVNGLGQTTILELSIVYRRLSALLKKDGLIVHDVDINSYCTCQEMGGFSITLLCLDDELMTYYDAPCSSPFYSKGEENGVSHS